MDIRSNLHKRMSNLKQNKDVNMDYKKIPSHAFKALAVSIHHSYRVARSHPFVTGLALFLLLLYSYLPSLFGFLISSSPVIICTTLLLGTLLSFGESDLPEIDEEEMKMSHDVSSSLQQVCAVPDDLVSKKDEEVETTASAAFRKREIEEPTLSLHVDEDVVQENESTSLQTQGVSVSTTAILEEDRNFVVGGVVKGDKREIEEDTGVVPRTPFHGFPDVDDGSAISTTERSLETKKAEDSTVTNQVVVDAATQISGPRSTTLAAELKNKEATTSPRSTDNSDKEGLQAERGVEESTERKDKKDEFFEKIYIHEEMLAEDASVRTESVPDLDPNADEDAVYVKAESDGTPTGICYYSLLSTKKSADGDDSGSDVGESSSSDASMGDIIPMLDELRPFLDADLSRPVHINIDSNEDDDDDDDEEEEEEEEAYEESSNDAKSDSAPEEHVAEDQPHPVTQKQKPVDTEFVLSWTPDDEKNLMDLGLSEYERNQRLENMIARRRARKGLENSMSFHDAAAALNMNRIAPLDVHIPPVSVRRNNPFDSHYDSQELNGLPPVPGSAPSVFSRRRNPFEFPYWERNDSHNATGEGLRPLELVPEKVGSSSEGLEGLTFGPSSSGDHREEKPDTNVVPHLPAGRAESVKLSKYERQLSRLSDPRLSSISEPESISPVVQGCDVVPDERDLLQENHMFPTANHDEDVSMQPVKEERDIDFSNINENLGILPSSELAQHEIPQELEPAISDAPQSILVEGESADKSDASAEKDDTIYANNHEVTIDPQSAEPYLSTDSRASLYAAPQGSHAQPDDLDLSGQDLNSADEAFITAHPSIERSIPYDIGNLSNDDATWLREIAEMRKLELSVNSQESQAQSNMHFASVSSTESESHEQLQVNNIHRMNTPMPYSQELTAADNITCCTPGHPYLPVDEPVHLPSHSRSESKIDILPPISEEIAADSDHEEHHGILGTVMDDAIDPSLSEYPTVQIEPLTVPPRCDLSTASPEKDTVETVNDGSVNLSIDEFRTSQFLDVQSYDEVSTTCNEVKEFDEGFLSELDVVGDFSVQNLSSSGTQCADKSMSHSHLGDNGPSSVIFEEARALCENQELSIDISQSNCHLSPLPENDISTGLPAKEYRGDDLRLLDSSVEHHNGETSNVEVISSVLQELDASSDRNDILDSATDNRFLSQMEFNQMGFPGKELDAPEEGVQYEKMASHSHMQEVEAESINDIHHALRNFVSANQSLTEQPTNTQFISSLRDAEAHNLECTDLAVAQLCIVSSSHIPIQNIEDIGISCHDEGRSSEVVRLAVEHQIEFPSNSASGKSEAETVPLLVLSHSSLNEVEASVEDSSLSTRNVPSASVATDCGRHEVEEIPLKDAIAAMPVVTADLDNSKLKNLEDVQLTVRQKEACSESAAACSALPEVEENSPEDFIWKQKDAYSEPVTTHADLPEAKGLSLKEVESAFFQQGKQTDRAAAHSQMHEVEARSVDDLHAVFRQQGIESAYVIHSEPNEVEEHSAENLLGPKLNFSLGQEYRLGLQTIEHSEMHEIEAQSLEDIQMAFERQITETKSETDLREIETKTVDELLAKEVQNLGSAMDPPDMHSEVLGDYSEIHEIEARSLDDLHVVFRINSEEDSPAIDSEPHRTEALSRTIVEKETTTVDCAVDQRNLSEMHEVEARSYDDLHVILQQQGVLAETVICSEPLKDEVRTVSKSLEKETTDGDSAMEQEIRLKPTDHSKMHEVEASSLDGLEIGFRQHSNEKIYEVQTQSAEDSMETEIRVSDLLVNQDLLDTEEAAVYGLCMSDEEQLTQFDRLGEGNLSSGSFVYPKLQEIEAHSLDDLHLALCQKTTGLETLEKEVNLSESQSTFHEIEAYSLHDLHQALGKHVTPLKASLILSDQHELETQPLGQGNMPSEAPEIQHDLHEIEVHSLDDLHLALGKQGMLSALTQEEHKVETQSLEEENACSGTSVSCLELPDIEVRSSGAVPLESSLVHSDLQKVEIQSPEKERKFLESATEYPELYEIEAESRKDINFAFEQLMENASTRDEHVEIEKTENTSNEDKSSSSEVSLPEAESSKLVSQVFVEDEALISNLDASSTKILE